MPGGEFLEALRFTGGNFTQGRVSDPPLLLGESGIWGLGRVLGVDLEKVVIGGVVELFELVADLGAEDQD